MQVSDSRRSRAVILTTQRTGSTFLVDCLGSHPQIECASEILIGDADVPVDEPRGRFKQVSKFTRLIRSGAWRPGQRMNEFFAGGTAQVRVFKAMYNHLANPFALRYLQRNEDVRILHLRRHNVLKAHVSRLLMPKRARVQVFEPVDAVQVQVDPAEVVASMRIARSHYERFERLFEKHQRLPLAYEELFDGKYLQAGTASRVCDFLGVSQHPMQSRIVKLNPESLRDMVSNYDELAEAVSRTEFADMLE